MSNNFNEKGTYTIINESVKNAISDTHSSGRKINRENPIKGFVRTFDVDKLGNKTQLDGRNNLVVYRGRSVFMQRLFNVAVDENYSDDLDSYIGWFAIGNGGADNNSQSPNIVSPYRPTLTSQISIFPDGNLPGSSTEEVKYADENGNKYYQSISGRQYKSINSVDFQYLKDDEVSFDILHGISENDSRKIDDSKFVDEYLIASVPITIERNDANGISGVQYINELGLYTAKVGTDGFPTSEPQLFCHVTLATLSKFADRKLAWLWNLYF